MAKYRYVVQDPETGKGEWVEDYNISTVKKDNRSDPTVDQYIAQNGGIKSNLDNKVYTSKRAYMEHLKINNHHIYE